MTVLDTVIQALTNLGGQGRLGQIYREYEKIVGHGLTPGQEAGIRACLERYSADSEVNRKKGVPDIFRSVHGIGGGYWGLRTNSATSSNNAVSSNNVATDPKK